MPIQERPSRAFSWEVHNKTRADRVGRVTMYLYHMLYVLLIIT